MDLGIKGKRALVTGASHGIGRATAVALAKEGCRVSVVARREPELLTLVDEMGGAAAGHDFYATDLMAPDAPLQVVTVLKKRGSDFDIVVHCVGGPLDFKSPLSSSQEWAKVWQFNVGIAIDINNAVIPSMQANKWGRIVHISSFGAENLSGSAPYNAAKNYLNTYTKLLGSAVAKEGIVVSAIMPGAILNKGGRWDENAEFNQKDIEEFKRKKADYFRHYQPIMRFGQAEEVVPFVLFMTSQQASFAAGAVIPVNGGGL